MGTFKSIDHQSTLLEVAKPAKENEYWTDVYKRPALVRKEAGKITCIAFSPDVNSPAYALSCGTRVNIHGEPPEWNRLKALTVFPQPVYGGHFRDDAKMFVCSCEDGIVRAFDITTATVLRQFTGHKMAVHACAFSKDGLKVGSAGDDRTVRIWDLSVGAQVACYSEHSDYARSIVPVPNDSCLWISGGYDRTVKFYDSRLKQSVRTIECSSIVEDILLKPGGVTLAVACDRAVYIWDTVMSSQIPIACLQHHHKTITSLCYASKGAYLLSAGLDQHIKVFDMDPALSFPVVATLDQPSPVVKLSISPDDRFLVAAMADSRLSVMSRKEDTPTSDVIRVGRVRPSRYFERVLSNIPTSSSATLSSQTVENAIDNKISVVNTAQDSRFAGREKLPHYDTLLKKFEHSKALSFVMKDGFRQKNPEVVVSLVDELIRRDALRIALAGRTEAWLSKALRFAGQQFHHTSFQRVLSEFVDAVVDVHADALLGSTNNDLRKAFRYFCDIVDTEWEVKCEANELVGAVECLLNQNQAFE